MKNCFTSAVILATLIGCSQRDVFLDQTSKLNNMGFDKELNVVSFDNKEDILNFIENYDSSKLNNFYDEGFVPFRVSDGVDENKFNELSAKKRNILYEAYADTKLLYSSINGVGQDDEYDEEDDSIINNDKFASVLSAKGDVLVGGKVYRYTIRGLYIVDKGDIEYLNDYLKDEKNTNPLPVGLNRLNDKIETYVPKRELFDGYSMDEITDDSVGVIDSQYHASKSDIVPMAGLNIPTYHYDNCTPNRPWIDNIFGRNYACEYRFTRKRKLRSTFAVEDYYLFFDVYAQAKFKKKTWFGWYSSRDANSVYVRVKDVNFQFERRPLKAKAKAKLSDIKKVFTEISKIFDSSRHEKISYVSNMYIDNGSYTKLESYKVSESEIKNAANSYYNIFKPQNQEPIKKININFERLFGKTPRKIFVVTILGKKHAITEEHISKVAIDAYKKFVSKINAPKNDDGLSAGVVVVKKDVNSPSGAEVVSYSFGEDIVMVHGYAVASRSFHIPVDFKLEEFSLGFSGNGSSWNPMDIGFIVNWQKPRSYDVSVEAGAYYDGRWGGSKFRVVKN